MKDISDTSSLGKRYSMLGTCAKEVLFIIEDYRIYGVEFVGSYPSNTIGLSSLLEYTSTKLENIIYGTKGTSCLSQLAQVIKNQTKSRSKKCLIYILSN